MLLPYSSVFAEHSAVVLCFFWELLLQQICLESTHCSVAERIPEMEKALLEENMTFRWKSNFVHCF